MPTPHEPKPKLGVKSIVLPASVQEVSARVSAARDQITRSKASLFIDPLQNWANHRCGILSASIAFYSAFSLAPTLLIVIAVASFFYGGDAIQGRLFEEIRGIVGNDAASGIQAMVANAQQAKLAAQTTIVSLAGVIVGATATFSTLNTALNGIWPVAEGTSQSSLVSLLKVRLISFGLVVGVGFLVVVLLLLDAAVAFVGHLIWGESSPTFLLANFAQHLATLVALCGAFTVLLKLLPDAPMHWHDALLGGLTAGLLFTGGKHLFALYLGRAGTANAFGAAGSLAVVLMWLYFSSAVFLLGAEVAASSGRRRKQRRLTAARLDSSSTASAAPLDH